MILLCLNIIFGHTLLDCLFSLLVVILAHVPVHVIPITLFHLHFMLVVTTTVRLVFNTAGEPSGFLPNDPLWDGQQCDGVEAPCCTHPNMPWFIKTLGETTTEDIQLRLCTSSPPIYEDIPLQLISLFVY